MTGLNTFSSNWPEAPANVIHEWLPNTCVHTMVIASFWPHLGPDPRYLMSLAILKSETATVFRAPEASTTASCAARASNLLGAVTNSSTTLSQVSKILQAVLDSGDAVGQLLNIATELLSESQWSGVLQVGSADFDDIGKLLGLLVKRVSQSPHFWQQVVGDLCDGSNVHHSWKSVVGRLRHVDVIVWMHRFLGAQGSAQNLNSPVADYLVGIHVRLSS
ncbi:hypothetical protein OGATHE_003984 [Ogataea polymorpha]|uniref:Uncharacterized protein n=1 Tax=Ogataea polymorpha TaxID=460523 RepID=A0A9P8P542_9ASCO|nr:hypothetical protein OGATHE_003984 [Ogataea polymorpha]